MLSTYGLPKNPTPISDAKRKLKKNEKLCQRFPVRMYKISVKFQTLKKLIFLHLLYDT